jgi:hypothetical protein
LGFSGAFDAGAEVFEAALTGFMGSEQQTNSQVSSHSQGFSTSTTKPHSSHSYSSPFFFAKKSPSSKKLFKTLLGMWIVKNIKISRQRSFER